MRLLDLRLDAYGPFTDRTLDLSAGCEGMHVIFGPNEAGKSSALRALNGLLYGIPERSDDDFVHRRQALRVGARLRDHDGHQLVCYRRKGRKDTLLDECQVPLAEDTLLKLLGGVSREVFERRFGIDYDRLVSGGRMLLEGHGEEAEALFGANLGGADVRALLDSLEQEARELFAPRASKPLLNTLIRRHDQVQRQLREASLAASRWQALAREADATRRELERVEAELADASRQRSALERVRRSLPNLRRRERLALQLGELAQVPELRAEFGEIRLRSLTDRHDAERTIARESARLEELRRRLGTLNFSERLLARADAIADLYQRLGSQRKAAQDRPVLVANREALLAQAERQLAVVRPGQTLDAAGDLAAAVARRPEAQSLVSSLGALEQREASAKKDLAARTQRLDDRRRRLEAIAELPDPTALEQAVSAAQKAGDLDAALAGAERALARHQEACRRELGALGLWHGDAESLAESPLPSNETLHQFENRLADLEARRLALDHELASARQVLREAATAIDAIQRSGRVPEEADLGHARRHRDRGWQLLRRHWLQGEDIASAAADYDPARALPEAFESAVEAADSVADRLRREAERVQRLASERGRQLAAEARVGELTRSLAELAGEHDEVQGEWRSLWTPLELTPLSPREMREWVGRAQRLRERVVEGAALRDQAHQLADARRALGEGLARVLGDDAPCDSASSLAAVLTPAESRLRQWRAVATQRQELISEIDELEHERRELMVETQSAVEATSQWRNKWAAFCRVVGLAVDATTDEALGFLEVAQTITRDQEDARKLELRLLGIDRDAEQFQRDASGLLADVAPDLATQLVAPAVEALHARLGEQREKKARWRDLHAQIREAEDLRRDAQLSLKAAQEQLAALCREAAVEAPEALEACERRAREREHLRHALTEVEAELLQGADGLTLSALEAECSGVDPDTVAAEIAALDSRIEESLQPRQRELAARRADADRDLREMSGQGTAAALAEEAQQVLAEIRARAEDYQRLRLAQRVLRDEMERFRREHRGPILARASVYFQRLTLGSFSAVESDLGDQDQPVLVGLRGSGDRVGVEAMSTGTRDQLYLALRLASLEHSLEHAEPLPFVVDDVLIQFDDDRARSTLEALLELSAKVQVIVFTHHGRVAEQAEVLADAGGEVFVHRL